MIMLCCFKLYKKNAYMVSFFQGSRKIHGFIERNFNLTNSLKRVEHNFYGDKRKKIKNREVQFNHQFCTKISNVCNCNAVVISNNTC